MSDELPDPVPSSEFSDSDKLISGSDIETLLFQDSVSFPDSVQPA
jgi:hypothetical protein